MPALGTFLLLTTFVVCSYAAVSSVVGARRGSRRLVESGIGAFYLISALMTVASAVMINAFLTDDFSIKYVVGYSESAQPFFYKITAYWGGLDGSVMFWVFLLSIFGTIAVAVNRERYRELIPYVVAVISVVQMFFLFLMVVHNNPFGTYLTQAPTDGEGLNPLLQNYWMVIHPPTLYVGFVGMTIPYAFGMAALITGHLDDAWLRAVRRWTMFAWLFLSLGLMLGMIWAYEELGWGGYWMWDPVENAALLPWFTATAFLHSVMVQERRSMLRIWNVTLIILTFFLTIFGTFLTRSGVVQSVHSFTLNPALAWLFTGFMVVILAVSFGLVIYRMPLLKSRNDLDSWLSREAAFLANNWIMLFSAFFIAFVTMFPTLSEAIAGERITVSAPFYNKWMMPIGLSLLLLTGIGPLLAWRKSTVGNLKEQFLWPISSGVVALGVFVALGFRVWVSGICFALCAFVMGTIVQEFWRGANVRRGATGTDVFTALVGLVGRNKRRYGGYVVHIGAVLIFFGFAGEGFKKDELVILSPGQQTTVGDYTIKYDRLGIHEDSQKQATTAYTSIFRDGKQVAALYPAKWAFHKREGDPPTTEVGIKRGLAEDLYIVLAAADPATQAVSLQIVVNPLVNWIWLGFGVLAIGTGIALLPERSYSFALAKLPATDAATTTAALILALVLGAAPVYAQHSVGATNVPVVARTPLERQLQDEIICMCGTCGRQLLNACQCPEAVQMRAELSGLVKSGMTHDQVIQYYIDKYGSQEPLAAPIDKGFNRLAWFIPYLVGVSGAAAIGFVALRWSRRQPAVPAEAQPAADPDFEERLDDELRNLD
jgi:cytochrome c-type biogenesis protein CcmF